MPRIKLKVSMTPREVNGIGKCFALCDLELLATTTRKRTVHWHQHMGLPVQKGPRQMKVVAPDDLWQWISLVEDPWSPAVTRLRLALEELALQGVINGPRKDHNESI